MDLLNSLFLSAPWGVLRAGLHVAFLLVLVYLLKQMFDLRKVVGLRHLAKPRAGFNVAVIGIGLLFIGVLGYQASWQLSGTARQPFVAFMQSHDRRQFNPAHWIERGRILDHRGQVLAESRVVRSRTGNGTNGEQVQRVYPYGPGFAHVVGYADPRFGTSGMEAAGNISLNGGSPENWLEWGELGRQLVTRNKRAKGRDLALTLDADLQSLAYQLLGGRPGAVVMLVPSDGAVRVLTSSPSFDCSTAPPPACIHQAPRSRWYWRHRAWTPVRSRCCSARRTALPRRGAIRRSAITNTIRRAVRGRPGAVSAASGSARR